MIDIPELEYKIELAKLDNTAFLVSKPGHEMSTKELADNAIRGQILDVLGNAIPILYQIERIQGKSNE